MRFALLWIIFLSSGAAAAKADDPKVATVTDLRGDVGHQRHFDGDWTDTSLDEVMFLFDLIRTGERSTTEMRFIDRTLLALGEKTRMKIRVGLLNLRETEPQLQAALKAAQLRIASQTDKRSLTQASPTNQLDAEEVVRIGLTTGTLTLAVDAAARFYRVEGPNAQTLFIAPGDRVRVKISDGLLVTEAIPQGFSFAAEFLFDAWDEDLFGPADGITSGSERSAAWESGLGPADGYNDPSWGDDLPGSLNPLEDMAIPPSSDPLDPPADLPSGIVIDVSPRGDDTP